jgi:NADPH-dependent 7-cyano-7-deazaguanine reductase QueF-like protein
MSCRFLEKRSKRKEKRHNFVISTEEKSHKMEKIIFFLLFINFCFSQNEKLSIEKIDSICNANGTYGRMKGDINVINENNEIIGSGGTSIKTYLNYYNQEYYNNLTREEKKRYNKEKDSELIKADFNQNILYSNNNQESIFAEFYYYKNQLFYLKIRVNKNDNIYTFTLNQSEFESKNEIKNELGLDLKKWGTEKNIEILKFHNN